MNHISANPIKRWNQLVVSPCLTKIYRCDINLSDMDIRNAGTWPLLGRVLVYSFGILSTLVSGYLFYLEPQLAHLDSAQKQEISLIKAYEKKAFQAANLPAYQQQVFLLQRESSRLNRQLPSNKLLPELIEQIGEKAQQHQVILHSLKLKPEQPREAYSAQPFTLTINGSYHNLGHFLASINQLERIVTLGDFTLEPDEHQLKLVIEGTTYHKHPQK